MKGYINKVRIYISLAIVLIATIGLFVVHKYDLFTNTTATIREVVSSVKKEGNITIDLGNRYYREWGHDNRGLYKNKRGIVRFYITIHNPNTGASTNDYNVYVKRNGSDVTSSFLVYKAVSNFELTLTQGNYAEGEYQVEVVPKDNNSGKKTTSFTIVGDYYNMTHNRVSIDGPEVPYGWTNLWTEYVNVDNASVNDVTLENVTKITGDWTDNDHKNWTDWFYIDSRDTNNNSIAIKSKITVQRSVTTCQWWGCSTDYYDVPLSVGKYRVKLKYNSNGVRGALDVEFEIEVVAKAISFNEKDTNSFRLHKNAATFEIKRLYNVTEHKQFWVWQWDENVPWIEYINENGDTVNSTVEEYNRNYAGIDLNSLKSVSHDDAGRISSLTEGNLVFQYKINHPSNIGLDDGYNGRTANIVGATFTDEGVPTTIKYYFSGENFIRTSPADDFNLAISDAASDLTGVDFGEYNVGATITKRVNGFRKEFENVNRSIRYGGGGKFIFRFNYDNLEEADFNRASIDVVNTTTGVTVFRKIYNGKNEEPYAPGNDRIDKNDFFTLTRTNLSTNPNVVTYELVYDGDSEEYAGQYEIRFNFINQPTKIKRFEILSNDKDYYLTSTVDAHISSEDPMLTQYPAGNKRYEYYVGFHMVAGDIDPSSDYSSRTVNVNIYDRPIDYDSSSGQYYFYKEQNYIVKILKKTSSDITYLLANNGNAELVNWTEGTDCTRVTDSLSSFAAKYPEADELLDKYQFDADGNIKTTTNYVAPISRYRAENNKTNMVTFVPVGSSTAITKPARDYVDYGGNQDTIVATVQHLMLDADGYVQLGAIRGTNRVDKHVVAEADIDNYSMNDLFKIQISENKSDVDHAIKILPKTEVDSGTYYVYVEYDNILTGIGYVNDGSKFEGGQPVVKPSRYPENWLRNTHMTSISYINPEYDIEIHDPVYSNSKDEKSKAYYNVESFTTLRVEPEYIYNYSDVEYKLQRCTSLSGDTCASWADVTSGFDMTYYSTTEYGNLATIFYPESDTPWNKDEELEHPENEYFHYIKVTSNNVIPGKYRLVTSYTHDGFGLVSKPTPTNIKEFDINTKYYGLNVSEKDDMWFAHNFPLTRTIKLTGEYVQNAANMTPKIYYKDVATDVELTKDGEYFYNTIDGRSVKQFKYIETHTTTGANTVEYVIELTNVASEADNEFSQIGDYYIEFDYQETGFDLFKTIVDFQVTPDQYYLEYNNEYPRATEDEMSFAKDIKASYIPESNLDNIRYTVYYNDPVTQSTVDVSSTAVATNKKHFSKILHEDMSCDASGICNGKVRFYINKSNIDMDGYYFVEYKYGDIQDYFEITKLSDMFDWNATLNINGTFNGETINGFYKNVSDTKLNVDLTSSLNSYPHQHAISYSIVDGDCGEYTNPTCNIMNDMYGALFDKSQPDFEHLVLTPKKQNGEFRIGIGNYKLVLFYTDTDSKTIDFTVHPKYVKVDYGEISLKSTYTFASVEHEVDGIYTNLPGTVTLPTTVKGVQYSEVERYVLDSTNNRTNAFNINNSNDFANNHRIVLTYDPNSAQLYEGIYTIVTEYVDGESGDVIREIKPFNVHNQYFDLTLEGVESNPSYPIVNKPGTITFKMKATNIPYLWEEDSSAIEDNGQMGAIASNTRIVNTRTQQDVTNKFSIHSAITNETFTDGKFDINVSYEANALTVDTYKFTTYYTINSLTRTIEEYFTLDSANRLVRLGEVEIESQAPDNKVHNSHYGKFIINYSLNDTYAMNDMVVGIKNSSNEDASSKFVVNKQLDKLELEVLPSNEVPAGDYTITFTLDGITDTVTIHVYDVYVAELGSSVYEVTHGTDKTIFVNSINNKQTKYIRSTFLLNLTNLHEGYKLLDKNNNDVTSTVNYIGTGMKLVNPDDATYTIILIGDLNQDSSITLGDVAMLFTYVTQPSSVSLNNYQKKAGDIRKQNAYALGDVAKLFSYVTKSISEL